MNHFGHILLSRCRFRHFLLGFDGISWDMFIHNLFMCRIRMIISLQGHFSVHIGPQNTFIIHNRWVFNRIVHGKVLVVVFSRSRIIDRMDLMLVFNREKGIQKLLLLPSALALLIFLKFSLCSFGEFKLAFF